MDRHDVITRLVNAEAALRAHGVGALYLFGSYARDEASRSSDVDVFVDPKDDAFYDLSNFMGAYEDLLQALPDTQIGYSTRSGLSKYAQQSIEQEAIRVF